MTYVFYIAAAVAVFSTFMAITRANAVHALLYMITSLLSSSLIFFVLGAPYIAALQAIVYAGAIMVLFVFIIMMLNQGPESTEQERVWISGKTWMGPTMLCAVLLAELIWIVRGDPAWLPGKTIIHPQDVSKALYGPYILVIELASMLLTAGLVGAYHLGRREPERREGES